MAMESLSIPKNVRQDVRGFGCIEPVPYVIGVGGSCPIAAAGRCICKGGRLPPESLCERGEFG